ncbi:hypothetical protein M2323_000379 [Rhodoblastus acidophilus]|uniref:Spy/CpxP family protein refolding chaperone n=1 Tax=Rhodoblastus acidophilus TaxID=1074 RepID=UPI0022240F2C|nr:Spy/CpxP family protein refolding chaperone [Rhodoblastus acidophilus]MCW2282618.1 hypothetical protein [Rhodoblastus acidophilus]MCW2331479.1 hypothetical protein [Rhodoblastus acidophilus]
MNRHFRVGALAAILALPVALPVVGPAMAEHAAPAAQLTEEDRAALTDARIAALKAGLKLTPAQEKHWDSLEKVLREVASARAARRAAFRERATEFAEKDEVVQAMKLGAKNLIARGEDLQKVADATAPLFDTLDAAQKHRFTLLVRSFIAQAGQK